MTARVRRSVAVVGAGIAGIAAARALRQGGVDVAIFDKGRAAGGRVATRRREDRQFDHGAQYFTVRSAAFAAALRPLQDAGAVQRWAVPFRTLEHGMVGDDPRPGAERWVGAPGMSALPRALADGLPVATGGRVEGLARSRDGWRLRVLDVAGGGAIERGPFDAVVLAIPTAQARDLLAANAIAGPAADAAASRADALQPCLAALVAFSRPIEAARGAFFVTDEILSWAAHDGGKPGRGGASTYVLHGSAPWSTANFDRPPDDSARALVDAFGRCLGRPLPGVAHVEGHRWRFALAVDGEPGASAVVDAEQRLALCGDGLVGGRVEGAWLSGAAAAEQLLAGW